MLRSRSRCSPRVPGAQRFRARAARVSVASRPDPPAALVDRAVCCVAALPPVRSPCPSNLKRLSDDDGFSVSAWRRRSLYRRRTEPRGARHSTSSPEPGTQRMYKQSPFFWFCEFAIRRLRRCGPGSLRVIGIARGGDALSGRGRGTGGWDASARRRRRSAGGAHCSFGRGRSRGRCC